MVSQPKNKINIIIFAFLLIPVLFLLSTNVFAVSCGDTITTDTTLTSNLTCNGTALTIGADNITLDGNGYSIVGNGSTYYYGVYDNGHTNVTVKNTKFDNFTIAISFVNNSNNCIAFNNTINNSKKAGIHVNDSINVNISYNHIYDTVWDSSGSDDRGFCDLNDEDTESNILICYSNNTTINHNYMKSSLSTSGIGNHDGAEAGITIRYSNYTTASYNTLYNTGDNYGFRIYYTNHDNYTYNLVNGTPDGTTQNTNDGFIVLTNYSNFSHNTIFGGSEWGIFMSPGPGNSHNNYIYNNTIYNINYVGIRIINNNYNNTVDSNTIYNVGDVGIDIAMNSQNNTVKNNIIHDSNKGIGVGYDPYHPNSGLNINNRIINNIVYSNNNGIYLDSSASNNIIINNTANYNKIDGIRLEHSSNNIITNNNGSNNKIDGIRLEYSSNNIITNNNGSNNGEWGVVLWTDCNYNNISNNILSHNTGPNYDGRGLVVYHSSNNNVVNNTAFSNELDGIHLTSNSNNNKVINNTAFSNELNGIWVDSKNITIVNNILNNNGVGIGVGWGTALSSDLNITHNIINNTYIAIAFISDPNNVNDGVVNSTIQDNIIQSSTYGIYLYDNANNNIFRDNNIKNTTSYGIYIGNYDISYLNLGQGNSCNNNIISNNNITSINTSIYIVSSNNMTIDNNELHSGYIDFYFENSSNNNLNNNFDAPYYGIAPDSYGLILNESNNNSFSNNIFSNHVGFNCTSQGCGLVYCGNGFGVKMINSNNNNFTNNIVENNTGGYGCYYSQGDGYGFYLVNSSNNTLIDNNIKNNCNGTTSRSAADKGYGIGIALLNNSNYNLFENNNLINNSDYGIYSTNDSRDNNIIIQDPIWIKNNDILIAGNITLYYSMYPHVSNLTIYNSTITFMNNHSGEYGIKAVALNTPLESGGSSKLNVINSKINSSNSLSNIFFELNPEQYHYAICRLKILNSTISNVGYGIPDSTKGLSIYSYAPYIKDSLFVDNNVALILYANDSTIENNRFINNTDGIYIYSDNNTIKDNTFDSMGTGLVVYAKNDIIQGNDLVNNNYGVVIIADAFNDTITENNFINNTIGLYIMNNEGHCQPPCSSAPRFVETNETIKNNNFINNTYGISIHRPLYSQPGITYYILSIKNKIMNNTFDSNNYSIYSYATNNTISGNKIRLSQYGILFNLSSWYNVTNNVLCNNNYDFDLINSSGSNGSNNYCENPDGWNDLNKQGCSDLPLKTNVNLDGVFIDNKMVAVFNPTSEYAPSLEEPSYFISRETDYSKLGNYSSNGLVAEYRFDNLGKHEKPALCYDSRCLTSGTTYDTSGYDNTAKYYIHWVSPSNGAYIQQGVSGDAISLDGDDYVEANNSDELNPQNQISVELWVKPNANTSPTKSQVFVSKAGPQHNTGYAIGYYGEDATLQQGVYGIGFIWEDGAVDRGVLKIMNLTTKWYHIVGTYNGTETKLYINGELVQPDINLNGTGPISVATNPLDIGRDSYLAHTNRDSYDDRLANAIIDNVRIYNRTLNYEEVKAHYSCPTCIVDTNLTPKTIFYKIKTKNFCSIESDVYAKHTKELIRPVNKTGVNLVSLPVEPEAMLIETPNKKESLKMSISTAEDLLKTASSGVKNADYTSYWNATEQMYKGHPYAEKLGFSIRNFKVKPGYGYFVSVYNNTNITLLGKLPELVSYRFHIGRDKNGQITSRYNYIVLPLNTTIKKASDLCNAVPNLEKIGWWDPSTQTFGWSSEKCPIVFNDFNLEPGKVYWLKMSQEGNWTQE